MSDIDLEPAVSILIPIYKVEGYIERCARSVFEQTYPNIEYIFCDDGSPDRSMEVLERVMKDYPERAEHTRIIRFPENKGLATVRNTLVDNCQTDWLIHEDSDDWMEPNHLENLVKKQQETGADIVCSDFIYHYPDREERFTYIESDDTKDYVRASVVDSDYHCCWGKLIRTSIYREHNIRIPTFVKKAEDRYSIVHIFYHAKKIVTTHVACHYNLSRTNRICTLTKDNLAEKCVWAFDTYDVVQDFLNDKEEEYFKLFNQTYYNKIIYNMILSASFGVPEFHRTLKSKLKTFEKQYPYVKGSLKFQIKNRIKSNYLACRLSLKIASGLSHLH